MKLSLVILVSDLDQNCQEDIFKVLCRTEQNQLLRLSFSIPILKEKKIKLIHSIYL